MSDTTKIISLPFFNIQSDWDQALSKKGGTCWVSVRTAEQDKSTHGELKCTSSTTSASTEISASEPFSIIKEKSSSRFITVQDQRAYRCTFFAPGTEFSEIHNSSIIALDVSEGGLGVSICTNNQIKVWETRSGIVRTVLQGHPIDAYTCRFFPSGIVIVTGGTDCCLKIWSAETGDCPVTLKGHKGAIQDACIVERGRNIISVSKDSTVKLWDCGESKCLATLLSCSSTINACCIMSPTLPHFDLGFPVSNMSEPKILSNIRITRQYYLQLTVSEREVLTGGKLLIVAREDGKVTGVGVASRKELFTLNLPSSGNCCSQVGTNAFAVGCQGGEIGIFDLRKLSQSFIVVGCTTSPILDLLVHPKSNIGQSNHVTNESMQCFWASKADGTCVLIDPASQASTSANKRLIMLSGPDCDAVYKIKKDLDCIYTCCRDGTIRKYSINAINKLLL